MNVLSEAVTSGPSSESQHARYDARSICPKGPAESKNAQNKSQSLLNQESHISSYV